MSLDVHAIQARIRSLRQGLAEDGITHVALFGSRARGDHRPDSDIDLLIEVDETRKFSLLDWARVERKLKAEIGLDVNLMMRRSLRPQISASILRDVVAIF